MSVFKDLNHANIDLSEFEEKPLSRLEEKRILKQAKKKISPKGQKKWLNSIIAAAVIGLSLTVTIQTGVLASIPFIGEAIEKYISTNEKTDYSSYKTAIGETAENHLGKLTLNEVMMDDKQLFLSATFEPAKSVDFDYKTQIFPSVRINGQDYTDFTGAQSIELTKSMYTIYNDIELNESVNTQNLQIEISYDTWKHRTTIEQPWTFEVEMSQAQLLKDKEIFEINKTITLSTGDKITIEKVVSTPISTTVYYDLSQSESEDIKFIIRSEGGDEYLYSSAFTSNSSGDVSYVRFFGVDMTEERHYLVPQDFEDKLLYDKLIPIN
ncbi:DUF4179 domain-containing protein [Bacillaceae bacterium W0354]